MPLNAPVPNIALSVPLFSAAAPSWSRRLSGAAAGQVVLAMSPAAATLYGVNHPGNQTASRCFRFTGDGTSTVFTLPTVALGVVYPVTAAAGLTVINYLEAIAMTFAPQYQANAVVRRRMGSDATVATTEWKINGATVTFGTAPVAGQIIEVLVPDPTSIVQVPGAALVVGTPTVIQCRSFMTAGVGIVTLFPAGAR